MVKKHRIHSQSKLSDEASASHKLGAQKSATGPKTQHPSRLTWEMDAQRAGRGKAGQESEWEGGGGVCPQLQRQQKLMRREFKNRR